jgi:Dual specificity phosphatase, catalytic domain
MSRWFERFGHARIRPRLIVGAIPLDRDDVAELAALGVTAAYNLCEDAEYGDGGRRAAAARRRAAGALSAAGITERRLPLPDYGGLPPAAIEQASAEVRAALAEGQTVYLHCRAGWQRSAAMAAAVVALEDGLPVDAALEAVRRRKPTADPLPHQRNDLAAWHAGRVAGPAP